MAHTATRRAPCSNIAKQPDTTARLMRRIGDGAPGAWDELVERFSPMLWSIAAGHRLSAADSADVVATTWLLLVENVDKLARPERVGAWLRTVAGNECHRAYRHSHRQIPVGDELPEPVAEGPEPIADVMVAERDAILREAMARLRSRDQELLWLTALPDVTYREIAAELELPIGSIGPTRGRCLQRLVRELERIVPGGMKNLHDMPAEAS